MPLESAALSLAQARLEQLRRQIDADVEALVADVVGRASAEREAAVAQARAEAKAEAERGLEEAVARARAETARAFQERVAAAEEAFEKLLGQRRAEVREEAAQAFAEQLAAAEEVAARKLADELAAAEARAAQALTDALAAADDRAARAVGDAVAAVEERAADTFGNALAAADDRAARAVGDAVAAAREQAAVTLRETVAATEARAAQAKAAAVAAAEERAALAAGAAIAAERHHSAKALAEAVAEAEARAADATTLSGSAVDARIAAAVGEVEERGARARAEAVAAAQRQAAQTLSESLASARAQAVADLATCVVEARADERQCDLACLDRIMQATRSLDGAISLTQVLDRLAESAAPIAFGRIALLVARDTHLRGWKLVGFGDQPGDASRLHVALDGGTVVSRAFASGEPATTRDGDGVAPPPFAPLPDDRVGLALPLRVGGRTVAVLYADDLSASKPSVPSAWPEALEILTRHASRSLELLTLSRVCGLQGRSTSEPTTVVMAGITPEQEESAQRYARLLVSEIKLYHEETVNAGRRDGNLLERLGPEVLRARRLYAERVPAVVRAHADYFGQELVRTLANGDPLLLGQAT